MDSPAHDQPDPESLTNPSRPAEELAAPTVDPGAHPPETNHDLMAEPSEPTTFPADMPLLEQFEQYRARLKRVIERRMDSRLRSRVDSSDVVQEVYMDLARRHQQSPDSAPQSLTFGWMQVLAMQKLMDLARHHLRSQKRDITREIPIHQEASGSESGQPQTLADRLPGTFSTPSAVLVKQEEHQHVHKALEQLEPHDREVIVLRQLRGMSNAEVAAELGITPAAASKRFLRALDRFRIVLANTGEFSGIIHLANIKPQPE